MLGVTLIVSASIFYVTGRYFKPSVEVVVSRRTVNAKGGRPSRSEGAHHAEMRLVRLIKNVEIPDETVKGQSLLPYQEILKRLLIQMGNHREFVRQIRSDDDGLLAPTRVAEGVKAFRQIGFNNGLEFSPAVIETRRRFAGKL